MGKLSDLITKLEQATPPKQEAAILDIVAENENLIIDLNTGQLLQGVDAQGEFLQDYRNPQYALFKLKINPRGVTDLNLTGAFHRSFVLLTDRFPVVFSASDPKTEDLAAKYGEDIFGLTEQNKDVVTNQYLKNSIVEYYRNLFQL